MQRKGIFCLEGDWWGVRDRTTVEPVFRLLEAHGDYRVPYIHRDIEYAAAKQAVGPGREVDSAVIMLSE